MKKIAVLLFAIILVVSLPACGSDTQEPAEWEKFIAEYNSWVDDYLEIVDDYKANPTDVTILTKYTEMVSEVTEWSAKADTIAEELKDSPEDAAKFSTELVKIAEKLSSIG